LTIKTITFTIIFYLTNNLLFGQTSTFHLDSVKYDNNLNNILFNKTDTMKKPIYLDSGLPYYNMPINSNCYTSGDFGEDTLVFCDCIKRNDSIFVEITNPTVCCYYKLTIQIVKGQFTSYFNCSYDISPAQVYMTPNKQTLLLKNVANNIEDNIEGYISFDGKGKYAGVSFNALTRKEKNTMYFGKVAGYFKCKIK